MTLPVTTKPQAIAARAFIEAMHARRAGAMSDEQVAAVGANLNATIAFHGKP
jgi:hypothetical protein